MLMIFGYRWGELNAIQSSIEYNIDKYRQSLGNFMEDMDKMINNMKYHENNNYYGKYLNEVHGKYKSKIKQIPELWELNEAVLSQILRTTNTRFTYALTNLTLPEESDFFFEQPLKSDDVRYLSSYDSIDQVVVHMDRDWSQNGCNMRQKLYSDGIISLLNNYFNQTTITIPRQVMIPGAALGRLAIEIAANGFIVEANECSGAMLVAFHGIFNRLLSSFQNPSTAQPPTNFYPHLNYPLSDDWDFDNRFKPVLFPYHQDTPSLKEWFQQFSTQTPSPLTLQFGDFVAVYGHEISHYQRFDAVVTCYFIDTGENILEYLMTIHRILKPDGIWINTGPLHYHRNQNNHQQSKQIFYSYSSLLEICESLGFKILSNKSIMLSYCGEDETISMKPEMYHIPITMFQKISSI